MVDTDVASFRWEHSVLRRDAATARVFTIRALACLAGGVLLLPEAADDTARRHVVVVMVAWAALQLTLGRVAQMRVLMPWLAIGDLAFATALAVVEPIAWPAIAIWIGAVLATTAIALPVRWNVSIAGVALVSTLTTDLLADQPHWPLVAGGQIATAGAFMACGALLRRDHEFNESELLATVTGAGAIVSIAKRGESGRARLFGDLKRVVGYTFDEWSALDVRELIHPDDLPLYPFTHEVDDRDAGEYHRLGRFRHKNGSWVWVRDITRVQIDASGNRVIRSFFVDVTDIEESRRRLVDQARTDVLTDLPNRLALMERLDRQIESGRPFALVLIDLDRFKEVNDTLGHEAGDSMLRILGGRLLGELRPGDHLSRLGGDEFAVVLDAVECRTDVERVVDQFVAQCARPITLTGVRLAVSMSGGIVFGSGESDRASLLRHADIAMYRAKRTSAAYHWFDASLERTSTMQLTLSAAFPEAIERGQVRVHFQPQFDLVTGDLVGAEALARWHHPEFGILQPDAFLDIALMADAADAFTMLTVDQAISMIGDAVAIGHPIPIAINVAARSMCDVDFADKVIRRLDSAGVDHRLLTIEISENDAPTPSGETLAPLHRLAHAGVRIAIDDFGSGHSSLSRLRAMSIDELKIAGPFISQLVHSARDRQIVLSIVELAAGLGCRVVAEGIETPGQARTLRDLGCAVGQGYLFSRPIAAAEFRATLIRAAAQRQAFDKVAARASA